MTGADFYNSIQNEIEQVVAERIKRTIRPLIIKAYNQAKKDKIKKEETGGILVYTEDECLSFSSIQEAAAFTKVSPARIKACIKSGQSWKTFSFDEL